MHSDIHHQPLHSHVSFSLITYNVCLIRSLLTALISSFHHGLFILLLPVILTNPILLAPALLTFSVNLSLSSSIVSDLHMHHILSLNYTSKLSQLTSLSLHFFFHLLFLFIPRLVLVLILILIPQVTCSFLQGRPL